ncbi:MAG: OmpA family protein [Oleispira sp.]|nr:OmpA family protein [Oleispira sp.]
MFDNETSALDLPDPISLNSSEGFTVLMQNAQVDLKAGTMTSRSPVEVRSDTGFLQANKLIVDEDGKRIPSAYVIDLGGTPTTADNSAISETLDPEKILQAEEIESLAEAIERQRLEQLKAEIEAKIEASPTLSPFKNQMTIDITTEGLRIQIVDQTKRPMFNAGSAVLKYYSEDILYELAPMLMTVDNPLSITGHTDSDPYASANPEDDANWELSARRANSARRALMEAGIEKSQIAQILGMGDTAPLDIANPESDINRRIAIVLLNKRAQEGIKSRTGTTGSGVKFINGENLENQDKRKPVINTSGSLINKLKDARERSDNSYDTPPNQEESFW